MSDPSPPSPPAELVAELRRTPGQLRSLSGGRPGGRGGWSPAEVVAHLAHFEVLAGARIRMVLTLDRPPATGAPPIAIYTARQEGTARVDAASADGRYTFQIRVNVITTSG